MLEHSAGYPNYPTHKWNIWASFQTSRKAFRKLQKAIWLTVTNKIFKFPLHLGPFCQIRYFFKLSSGYPNYLIQKWYIWASSKLLEKDFVNYSMELLCKQEWHVIKFLYKSILNSAWLWSWAQFAISKKQKCFSLPDHKLAENPILVYGF